MHGVIKLNKTLNGESGKILEDRMRDVFKENIHELSPDFQRILVNDMVTAFKNRINVLIRVESKN